MQDLFARVARAVSHALGSPVAFLLAVGCILAWAVIGFLRGFSDTHQLVVNTGTTIVTFLMVFLIQNTQNRDSAAMHRKLDELIRALDGARNKLIAVEEEPDEQLTKISDELKDYRDEPR